MAAVALWKRGRVDYEVEVRSRPDATGMVDVHVYWSNQAARAHRDSLEARTEAARKLLELAEKFVALPGPERLVRPSRKLPAPKPKVERLPGTRIERQHAEVLFGADVLLGIKEKARLRLIGSASGSVVLRAYDELGMICERPYVCRSTTREPVVKAVPTQPIKPSPTVAELKSFVHPDFGAELRTIVASDKLVSVFGSHGQVRRAIYFARKDPAQLSGWAFAMNLKNGDREVRCYAAKVRKWRLGSTESSEIRVFLDDDDRIHLAEQLRANGIEFEIGAW